MLESLKIRNFTAFKAADLTFASGLNVIVGANGTAKTHLLKLPYAALAMSAEEGKKRSEPPTKALLQTRLADKMAAVFRPEGRLGHLVHRQAGRNKCEVTMGFTQPEECLGFEFSSLAESKVVVTSVPSQWQDKPPVFLPTRELLSFYPGFVSLYDTYYLQFEETWRDTCLLLGAPTLRGPKEKAIARLIEPLEQQLGGKIVRDAKKDRFYLQRRNVGKLEMPLVAEGWRKLGMLTQLISTGSLLDKGYLFWDEPEANLNPKLIREIARAILNICGSGVQVFVATHSLFLLRELEILLNKEFAAVEKQYFALRPSDDGGDVSQADDLGDVDPLLLLDEALEQSDRFLGEFMWGQES